MRKKKVKKSLCCGKLEEDRHRRLPRPGRKIYDHDDARISILKDFLSVQPIISVSSSVFRISRTRLERMLQDAR